MTILKEKRPIDYIIYSAIIVLGIILDQLSKWLIFTNMELTEPPQSIPIIKNVLHITYITNDGAAFGMMDDPRQRWIFIIVSTVAIIGFAVYLYLGHADNMLYGIAMSIVVSGGIGNMIDRFGFGFYVNPETQMGEVIDFIDFCAFPKIWSAIFNVADAFVCIGAGLLVLALILDVIKESNRKHAPIEQIAEQPIEDNADDSAPDEDKAE